MMNLKRLTHILLYQNKNKKYTNSKKSVDFYKDSNYNIVMKNAKTLLEEKNIRPSFQRLKIYKLLSETKEHPSVETIYNELKEEIPSLSKMTIYNTLKLFVENDLARLITIEENEARFDADTSVHGHFKCNECGRILDFPVSEAGLPVPGNGFKVENIDLFVRGICPGCRQQ